jgi:hypothetical protein
MSQRITQKDLERMVLRINRALNRPETPYGKDENGRFKANLGNFHISSAYGGVALEEVQTDGGGVRRVSVGGYEPKRALYAWMIAFLSGIEGTAEKGE